MQSLGESVADGKALIASAIMDKGVTCGQDATFADMAINISKIQTDIKHAIYAKLIANSNTHTIEIFVDGVKKESKSWTASNHTVNTDIISI